MSAEEKGMAELLARADREEGFSAVMAYTKHQVSAILDLGCGISALTTRLAERFPSALIVGIDRSKYLLSRIEKKKNVLTVFGDIPCLPFKKGSFDVVVVVQVLHEILHFKGADALVRTLQKVCGLLKKGSGFIIFDHVNPGDTPISLELSQELLKKLHDFQSKLKPRKISFADLSRGRIRTNMRDFYVFLPRSRP